MIKIGLFICYYLLKSVLLFFTLNTYINILKQNKMKTGEKIKIKNTQEVGTILEINNESIKVYVPKRGTFKYIKSNLEPVEETNNNDIKQ
jgi:hypothetical protein